MMDKSRLLNYIKIGNSNIEQIAAVLGDVQLAQSGAEGEWSVKDTIAHIAYWQQREADYLNNARGGGSDRAYDPDYNVDAINSWIQVNSRGRSAHDILAEYRKSYQELAEEIGRLSQSDLDATSEYPWTEGDTLSNTLAEETYKHVAEHLKPIRQWMEFVQGVPAR
jgi:hypothetical protein